ncbi:cytidine deaminase [candidate division WOR-3 bacterium]|uniref:Cytidine deaminase n=1 Tax=candidate division WOR-3 bacterium TaxID=2052148 RepID=A0A660SMY7_UNCW3|nr:MAG: cytidine deaminase [candidate division WOR-3 bacterium]
MEKISSRRYLKIITAARRAALNAYAPYSKIRVGAAIRTRSGRIYTGCNVENSSYPLSLCAERNAVGSAIAAGEKEFRYLVLSSPDLDFILPCGGCAQFLAEFEPDLLIITTGKDDRYKAYRLKDILALPFLRGE